MNNRFIVFLVIFVGMGLMASAQQKELSLQDAVIGQWRQFYPKRLGNLQWRPDTDMVTYRSERANKILQRGIKDNTESTLFDLAALGKAMGESLEYIPSIRWESKDVFRINHQGTIVHLSLEGTVLKIKSKVTPPKEVANLEAHSASQQFAYTKDNNVYLQTKEGSFD